MEVTGIITPAVYLSYTTKIVLQFSSDAAVGKRGFRVSLEFVDKGKFANFGRENEDFMEKYYCSFEILEWRVN